MKTCLQVAVVFFVATATASEPYRTTRERQARVSGKQQINVRRVRASMDSIVFPKVFLSGVSLREAIEWVAHNTARHAPGLSPSEKFGISTVSKFRSGEPELVSVSMQAATLPQLLDVICEQHDYIWRVETFALSIVPCEQALP